MEKEEELSTIHFKENLMKYSKGFGGERGEKEKKKSCHILLGFEQFSHPLGENGAKSYTVITQLLVPLFCIERHKKWEGIFSCCQQQGEKREREDFIGYRRTDGRW